jgi:outer membrane immunogenic protein
MFRFLWLVPVCAVCCGTPAFAHDWSGYYLGAHIGYTSTVDPFDTIDDLRGGDYQFSTPGMIPFSDLQTLLGTFGTTVGLGDVDKDGLIYGFQAGRNWQNGQLVFGFEADVSNAPVGGDEISATALLGLPLGGGNTLDALDIQEAFFDVEYLTTFRGRAGWAFDRFLVFGTGGLAVSNVEAGGAGLLVAQVGTGGLPELGVSVVAYNGRDVLVGWTLGGGVEVAMTDKISLKLEYQHTDLGSLDIDTLTGFGIGESEMDVTFDTVRAGVNFSF